MNAKKNGKGKGGETWAGKTFVSQRRTKMDKGKEDDQGSRKILRNRKYFVCRGEKCIRKKENIFGEGKYLEK